MTAEKVLGSHVGHVHVRQRLRDSERSLPAGALPRRECSARVGAWGRGESKFPGGNGCGRRSLRVAEKQKNAR